MNCGICRDTGVKTLLYANSEECVRARIPCQCVSRKREYLSIRRPGLTNLESRSARKGATP